MKSEQSHVFTILQTMVMINDRSMKNVHAVDNMSQHSIIGILHALFHRARFVNELLHMILTLTGEKLNNFETKQ